MRRVFLLVLTAGWLAIGQAAGVADRPGKEKKMGRAEESVLVQTLLRKSAKADRDHASPFFRALEALARQQGRPLKGLLADGWIEDGYAVRVQDGRHRRVVVILRSNDHIIPGADTQHLLLLDCTGHILDTLSCEISSRLTRMFVDSGTFRTDVDRGQLVIHYIPEVGGPIAGNWAHAITHAGKTHRYHWDQKRPGAVPSAEWEQQGLCRVAVQGGKFVVVFPKLNG
jgi:hypothetical protein